MSLLTTSQTDRNTTSQSTVPQLMTVHEIAVILRVTPQTVRQLIERGSIAAIRAGRQYRIRRDVFEKWLERR